MAGLGRRTHYRKHLTDSILHDFPEPQENERVAKVVSSRGGNQFDILLAQEGNGERSSKRDSLLAILPTKFRKLVWVKRNDYVIVQIGDFDEGAENEGEDVTGTIRCIVTRILYKEQVKHLKSKGLWPDNDPEFADIDDMAQLSDDKQVNQDDGILYDDPLDADDLFVNTNRIANLKIEDSSSEEEYIDEED